jgi:hypothetical protein
MLATDLLKIEAEGGFDGVDRVKERQVQTIEQHDETIKQQREIIRQQAEVNKHLVQKIEQQEQTIKEHTETIAQSDRAIERQDNVIADLRMAPGRSSMGVGDDSLVPSDDDDGVRNHGSYGGCIFDQDDSFFSDAGAD